MLGGVIDPDYREEIGLNLHNGGKKITFGVQQIV
jgi:dUTPase